MLLQLLICQLVEQTLIGRVPHGRGLAATLLPRGAGLALEQRPIRESRELASSSSSSLLHASDHSSQKEMLNIMTDFNSPIFRTALRLDEEFLAKVKEDESQGRVSTPVQVSAKSFFSSDPACNQHLAIVHAVQDLCFEATRVMQM